METMGGIDMKILKSLLFIFLFSTSFNIINSENRKLVIIIPECTSSGINLSTAKAFTSFVESEFVKSGRFIIVDRKSLDKILEEFKLQLIGLTDSKNTKQIGKILNADKFIFIDVSRSGSISMVDDEEQYVIKLNLVDIETSAIEYSYEEITNGINNTYKSLESACRNLINQSPIVATIQSLTNNIIYIDVGKTYGIENGKVYNIKMVTKLIKNNNGEIVLKKKEVVGNITIVDVDDNYSEAKYMPVIDFKIKEGDVLEIIPYK
jgi:hypothetical protein